MMPSSFLPSTKIKRIGILAELTGNANLEPMVNAAVCLLESNGFETLIVSAGHSVRDEKRAWEVLARSHCDGIIMHSDCLDNEQLARLISTRKHVVLVNLDNTRIGALAAAYLLKMGHRRLALVSGPSHRYSVRHTTEGFVQQFKGPLGDSVEMQILEASIDEAGGANAMNILLADKVTPTAVFMQSDHMAIGAMRICQENGIRVPHEVSILGCGDKLAGRHSRPSLSTVHQPLSHIGQNAATRVMNLVNQVAISTPDESEYGSTLPRLLNRESIRDLTIPSLDGEENDSHISRRERECLKWAAKGKTSWEISQILGVSESTIIYHLRNATRKLNAANRLHAVAKALKAAIIDF